MPIKTSLDSEQPVKLDNSLERAMLKERCKQTRRKKVLDSYLDKECLKIDNELKNIQNKISVFNNTDSNA